MSFLIIGNSAAAIGAIEGIRKIDKNTPITVVSEEQYNSYSRPLIAEYLSDTIDINKMWYRDESFYIDNNVNLLLNTKVLEIKPENKLVKTENNQEIFFDKCLIATGGTPFVPPIKGADTTGVFTFVRWDEAEKLKDYKSNIKHAVVIGGGLIGLKASEHLAKSGIKTTIVELAETILSLITDNTAAKILQKHFIANGVNIITENTVEEVISTDGKVSSVKLKSGQELDCDALVIAIGVVPNKQVVNNSNIKVNRGILVNEHLQTNISDIYAAGDVAEGKDLILEENRVLPLWPVAYKQGYIAGLNMAGSNRNYEGEISMNSLEFFHLPIISAGITKSPDETYTEDFIINERRKNYKKIIHKENKLYGYIFVNDIDRAGILTGLIKDKTDISDFKNNILTESFGLINIPKEIIDKKVELAVSPKN